MRSWNVAQKVTAMGIQRNSTNEYNRGNFADQLGFVQEHCQDAIDFLTKKRVLFTDVNLKKREKG
jgi:hypothetical protein